MAKFDALRQKAQEIRNEVQIGANTASRVGYVMEATIDALEDAVIQSEGNSDSFGTAIQMIQDEIEDLPSIRDNLDTLNAVKPEYYTEGKNAGLARLNAPGQVSISVGEYKSPPRISIIEELDEIHLRTKDGKASIRMTEGVIEVWAETSIELESAEIKSKALVPAAITQAEMETMQKNDTWEKFLANNPNVYVYE